MNRFVLAATNFVTQVAISFVAGALGVVWASHYGSAVQGFIGQFDETWYSHHGAIVLFGFGVFLVQAFALWRRESYLWSAVIWLALVGAYCGIKYPEDAPLLGQLQLVYHFFLFIVVLSQIFAITLMMSVTGIIRSFSANLPIQSNSPTLPDGS